MLRIQSFVRLFRQVETTLINHLFGNTPPPELAIACTHTPRLPAPPSSKFSLQELVGDGILLAVPKFRRTIERRWKRLYGNPEYNWKPLVPKTNIAVCNKCGHHYERHHLCANCYKQVEMETKEIQIRMEQSGKLKPIEKDVIVLYEGESVPKEPEEFWKGRRIIEMKKQRPQFFSKNLLQKTTQQPSESTDVKPNELA